MSGPVPQLMPAEVRDLVAAGRATALDVREPYEWEAGRMPGSVWIPMRELGGRLQELPDAPVVVVCRSGARSDHVAEVLAANGWDASNLAGGLQLWVQQGLPLDPPDGSVA